MGAHFRKFYLTKAFGTESRIVVSITVVMWLMPMIFFKNFGIWGDRSSKNSYDEPAWPAFSSTSACLLWAGAAFHPVRCSALSSDLQAPPGWDQVLLKQNGSEVHPGGSSRGFTLHGLSLLVWAQTPLLLSGMPVWVPDPWCILQFGSSVGCGSWKSASTLNHPPCLPLEFFSLPSSCLPPSSSLLPILYN